METEIKQYDTYFLKLLQDVIESLDRIDELVETNGDRQSKVDLELSDLLHLIENENLTDSACIKITRRIQELRKIRRSYKNEFVLIQRYQELKNRLSGKESRQFIVTEIRKTIKQLSQNYQDRILTKEEIENLLKENISIMQEKPKKRSNKRSVKSQELDNRIKELLEKGYNQTKIAKELNVSQANISMRIKKMKEDE